MVQVAESAAQSPLPPVRLQAKESLHDTSADKLVAAMQELGKFYEGKVYSVTDGPSQEEIRSLAHHAELQATNFAARLDHASQLAVDVMAATARVNQSVDLDTAVEILLQPQEPTERGLTGGLRFILDDRFGLPMVNPDVVVGPNNPAQIRTMSEVQLKLAKEGKEHFLKELGVLEPGNTEESLYIGVKPTRVMGAGSRNHIQDVMEQAGDIKAKIKPIVSRTIPFDSRGAIGTLPDSKDITVLTWEGFPAVHFNLGKEALKEAIQARMPKTEFPPPPVAMPTPAAAPTA